MRVALVTGGMPSRGTSGDSLVARTLVERLRALGHEVTAVVLLSRGDVEESRAWIDEAEAELAELGVDVRRIVVAPASPGADPVAAFFPQGAVAPEVHAALVEITPDVVLGFDTGTLLALRGYRGAPVFGIPGDPRHLVWRYQVLARPLRDRLSRGYARELLRYLRVAPRLERMLVELARECDGAGMFGAQHAAWLRSLGIPCVYVPLPVRDRRPAVLPPRPTGSPLRILHYGGLGTTGTRLGLVLLARDILPRLESALGPEAYTLRVVGSGSLAPDLARRLAGPRVNVVGFVEDSATEIAAADIFLAPSPYPVGARTRVAEALSIGVAIVAHRDVAEGIPELVDGENALLGATGAQLADCVLRLAGDPALRVRLAAEARATYERRFAPDVAGDAVVRELERLAATRG